MDNSIEPTIAEEEATLAIGPLKRSEVSGLHQLSRGETAEGVPIELELVMSVGVAQQERIVIETEELGSVAFVISNGLFGDTATANVVVNTAKTLGAHDGSGLLTMTDIRLARNVV